MLDLWLELLTFPNVTVFLLFIFAESHLFKLMGTALQNSWCIFLFSSQTIVAVSQLSAQL